MGQPSQSPGRSSGIGGQGPGGPGQSQDQDGGADLQKMAKVTKKIRFNF